MTRGARPAGAPQQRPPRRHRPGPPRRRLAPRSPPAHAPALLPPRLNDIYPWWAFRWKEEWKRTYATALKAARRGDLAFPDLSPDSDDSPLTRWPDDRIDRLDALTEIQHNLLGALPLDHLLTLLLRPPRGGSACAFTRRLRAARTFWRSHQHLNVPRTYPCTIDGYPLDLGRWIRERHRNKPPSLTREQLDALQALDMRWT
ncbi:helicase associated domain-containing protein [Streptomyces sp. NPDC047860]|uniref:helicase associated domain-containing protein n=1 Tax=Streptomyces sp. NPDC047860 TaxID=3155743 RepID=UPI003407EBEF